MLNKYPKLHELEVFCTVAGGATTQQAAERLFVTHSAVSQSIKRLETMLEQNLFDKVGNKLVVNEYGRTLYPQALSLLKNAYSINRSMFLEGGDLKIGGSSTVARYLFPDLIREFLTIYPKSNIQIKCGNTEEIISDVEKLTIDFGVIEGVCNNPHVTTRKWRDDILVIISAVDHPLTKVKVSAENLFNSHWIMREKGSGTRREVDLWIDKYIGGISSSMEFGDSELIWKCVARGLGISCLSENIVQEPLRQKKIAKLNIKLPPLKRSMSLIVHKNKQISKQIIDFFGKSADFQIPSLTKESLHNLARTGQV